MKKYPVIYAAVNNQNETDMYETYLKVRHAKMVLNKITLDIFTISHNVMLYIKKKTKKHTSFQYQQHMKCFQVSLEELVNEKNVAEILKAN